MPRIPKVYIRGKVHEICFRTEDGLPLVCTPYMTVILRGIIAEAFSVYDAKLISLVAMGNHLHLALWVGDPEHVDDIVAYIKRESAHAINHLLGRSQHTVWQEGFDCPVILDLAKMIERLCYIFLNPARADLVETIEQYPGLNSWQSLFDANFELVGRRVPRNSVPQLPLRNISLPDQQLLADELLEKALDERRVKVDPLSVLDYFPEGKYMTREELREKIVSTVKRTEAEMAASRKKPVLGSHALKLQSIRRPHEPKKRGKRVWVLGSSKAIRVPAIDWFKRLHRERALLKKLLSPIEFLQNLPPGFFAPGGYLRANLNPQLVPI